MKVDFDGMAGLAVERQNLRVGMAREGLLDPDGGFSQLAFCDEAVAVERDNVGHWNSSVFLTEDIYTRIK